MALEKIKKPTYATLFKLLQTGFDGGQPAIRAPSDLNDTEEVITEVVNGIVDSLIAAETAAIQATWFIDAVNGDDTNVGDTQAAPIKTFSEFRRRLGPNAVLQQTTTVTILSTTLAAGDGIFLQGVSAPTSTIKLVIRGTMTPNAVQLGNNGVLTGETPIDHTVADGAQTATIAAQDWTVFEKLFVRVNGGLHDGRTSVVVKANIAAGKARMSPFTHVIAGTVGPAGGPPPGVNIGDALRVINPTVVPTPLRLFGNQITLVLENLDFQDPTNSSHQISGSSGHTYTCTYCIFRGSVKPWGMELVVFNSCIHDGLLVSGPSITPYVISGAVFGSGGQGIVGTASIDVDTIFQGCNADFQSNTTGEPTIGDAAFYDIPNAAVGAIMADFGGRVYLRDLFQGHTIYGTGIAGFTLMVTDGGFIFYTDTASILAVGATSFASFSGVNKVQGDLPLAIDVHGNGIFSIA